MKYAFTLFLLLLMNATQAQYDKLYFAVLPFNSNTEDGKTYVESVRAQVIETLSSDYRFVLLERDVANAAFLEREYQKREDFIDGKIVEQGKAIGAEYLLDGSYDAKANQLTFSIYDVTTGALSCSIIADRDLPKEATGLVKVLTKIDEGLENLNETLDPTYRRQKARRQASQRPNKSIIISNIKQLMKECFPSSVYWKVLRPEEETKSKVKELLIAAGTNMGLKKGSIVEVVHRVIEEVDGFQLERYQSVGWGRVVRFENESFCVIKLEDGGKSIKKLIKAGNKLQCQYVKK